MLTLVRRFLLVQALLLWQGGFLFYALVVVPVGTEVLGSGSAQGFVTARVTVWLNRLGWPFFAVFAWDAVAAADPRRGRRNARLAVAAVGAAILFALSAVLHDRVDALLDPEEFGRVRDRRAFYVEHQIYLILSTAHWVLGLAAAWLTLAAWRDEDRTPRP